MQGVLNDLMTNQGHSFLLLASNANELERYAVVVTLQAKSTFGWVQNQFLRRIKVTFVHICRSRLPRSRVESAHTHIQHKSIHYID